MLYCLVEHIYLKHNHKVDYDDVHNFFHIYDGVVLRDSDDVNYHDMVISMDVRQQDDDYDENHHYSYKDLKMASSYFEEYVENFLYLIVVFSYYVSFEEVYF